jgi:hypothetical protein
MIRRAIAITFLLGAAISGVAHAETLRAYTVRDEPQLKGFRIESPGQADDVCILYPSQVGDCEWLNAEERAELLKSIGASMAPVALGMIRTPAGLMLVTVGTIPRGASDMSADDITTTLENLRAQVERESGVRTVVAPHRTKIRGHEALELSFERQGDGAGTEESVRVVLLGRDRTHQFYFDMSSSARGSARPLVEHMLTTLDYAPGDLGTFGHSKALGGTIERLLTPLGLTAVLGAAIALWWRRTRSRKKTVAAPAKSQAKSRPRRTKPKSKSAIVCPHCDATADQFREVQGVLICPSCGRSFEREED